MGDVLFAVVHLMNDCVLEFPSVLDIHHGLGIGSEADVRGLASCVFVVGKLCTVTATQAFPWLSESVIKVGGFCKP